jgi:hypothetical protein
MRGLKEIAWTSSASDKTTLIRVTRRKGLALRPCPVLCGQTLKIDTPDFFQPTVPDPGRCLMAIAIFAAPSSRISVKQPDES